MEEYFEYAEEPVVEEHPSVTNIYLELPDQTATDATKKYGQDTEVQNKVLFFQPPPCATIMYRKAKKELPQVNVTYDREEIRNKIDRITFDQARRLMLEIYKPVVEELYEAGCPCWAEHFIKFFEKEKDLKEEQAISDTLNDNRELLGAMVDKIKESEKARREPTTKKYGYQMLYDLILLLEPYKESFHWLYKDIFNIIANMCTKAEDFDRGCYEIIARLYFKYSSYLDISFKDVDGAHYWIEKAFHLARGELWPAGDGIADLSLHEHLAPFYSDILLRKARIVIFDNFDDGFALIHEAIHILCEVGIERFNREFCKAYLTGASLLTENFYFEQALKFLYYIEEKINVVDVEVQKMKTEYLYLQGTCFTNLHQTDKALEVLHLARKSSQKFEQRHMEGLITISIGQLSYKKSNDRCTAIGFFQNALQIFKETGNIENEKRAKYLSATLKSELIFPHFLDLMKDVDKKICSTYKLRQWKGICQPFWIDPPADLVDEVDPLYCLLQEDA